MTSMQSAVAAELMGGNNTASRFENSGQQIAAGRPDLMARVSGSRVQLDVPEPNGAGLRLARARGLAESFGCARMYHGRDPGLPIEEIFGVTSFEFG